MKNKMQWVDNELVRGPNMALCLNEYEFNLACELINLPKAARPTWIMAGHGVRACTHDIELSDGTYCVIVSLRPTGSDSLAEIVSWLVHEAVHIWQFACKNLGEHNPGIEIEAYSIQAISLALIKEYQRQTKKGKKHGKRRKS